MKRKLSILFFAVLFFTSCYNDCDITGYWYCNSTGNLAKVTYDDEIMIVRFQNADNYSNENEDNGAMEYYFEKGNNNIWNANEAKMRIRLNKIDTIFSLTYKNYVSDFIKIDSLNYYKILEEKKFEAAAVVDTTYIEYK